MSYKFVNVDPNARKIMLSNKSSDTKLEKNFRSMLFRNGFRFRKNYKIIINEGKIRIDIALIKLKIAIFMDGCFWHNCPLHGSIPKKNSEYWIAKFLRNKIRDEVCNRMLYECGWQVVRLWEHESDSRKLELVMEAIMRRNGQTR